MNLALTFLFFHLRFRLSGFQYWLRMIVYTSLLSYINVMYFSYFVLVTFLLIGVSSYIMTCTIFLKLLVILDVMCS